MQYLTNILPDNKASYELIGSDEIEINSLKIDSRQVRQNDLYCALIGTQADGHKFIEQAINKGANTILCSTLPDTLKDNITYVKVADTAASIGSIASAYYEHPSLNLEVVGITGTNGKTSCTTLLKNALESAGFKCGLISTVKIEIGNKIIPATHTTPDVLSLQKLLAQMVDAGCEYVFMEVSSHAIHQKRISGIKFKGAGFTNITHDHLDYHGTFKNYIEAKQGLFNNLPNSSFAITNKDDKNGQIILQNTMASRFTYSLKTLADFKAKILEQDFVGMHLEINGQAFYTNISGTFNAYNLCLCYGILNLLDIPDFDVLSHLSKAQGAEGRLQWIKGNSGIFGVVDYAHTPDALTNVLKALQVMNPNGGQIITVVGCGGNRDKTKRPKMAKIAAELSNQVVLTSDNPRNESPNAILEEMEAGIPLHKKMSTLVIADRKNAIKTAISLAKQGDLILVAGKGHEKYQEIKGVKHPFDDVAVLNGFLNLKTN